MQFRQAMAAVGGSSGGADDGYGNQAAKQMQEDMDDRIQC
jgi:hypothetical protein